MSGSIITAIALFIAFVTAAMTISYTDRVDSQRQTMRNLETAISNYTSVIESRKRDGEKIRVELESITTEQDRYTSLSTEKKSLSDTISRLKAEETALEDKFHAEVLRVRASAVGTRIPEMTLATGTVLKDILIRSVNETDVALNHALGVMRVQAADLPRDLRDKFRYGLRPMVDRPVAEAPPVEISAMMASTPPIPVPGVLPYYADTTPATAKIQIDIEGIDGKISDLKAARNQWRSRAISLRSQASNALSYGKPSYAYNAQAIQAEANAQAMDAQMAKLQEEQTRLRKLMVDVVAPNSFR